MALNGITIKGGSHAVLLYGDQSAKPTLLLMQMEL